MNLLNLLFKIGEDILTKPDSTASKVTQYILNNPETIKQTAEFVGGAFVALTSITIPFFNRINGKKKIKESYDKWKQTPNSTDKQKQEEYFKNVISKTITEKLKISSSYTSLNIGLEQEFAERNGKDIIIGIFKDGEVCYAEKVNYNSIDPELDRELSKDKLVFL